MFLFIVGCKPGNGKPGNIQIHLMFLFISLSTGMVTYYANSNTSHVLIYHNTALAQRDNALHSNTSHVLIYPEQSFGLCSWVKFKYISCSYLSLRASKFNILREKFKYISCSYLSICSIQHTNITSIQIHLMFLFIEQYRTVKKEVNLIQIHLMFLFIG